jgi:hypothetical protein
VIAALPALAGILALTVGDAEVAREKADVPAEQAATPRPCTSPEHHQFDFWIGDWNVSLPTGKPAGRNRITQLLGGCALREEWTGASGSRGTSLNTYDAAARRWRQTRVDNAGAVLVLEGRLEKGRMTLQGQRPIEGGRSETQRITWTPRAGGQVRQHWEASRDGGRTWKTEFDGTYRKAG